MPTFIESVIPVRSIQKLSLAGQRLLSKGFQAMCVNAQTVGKGWSKLIIQQPTKPDSHTTGIDLITPQLSSKGNIPNRAVPKPRAVLTGSVNSAATKAKAEQIVKAVRGVKSVDNQIVVLG